jgi:histidyl-tRNA synthetase
VTRLEVATRLRAAGVAARAELGERKLGRQLESAAKEGAHLAVIVGDELAASGLVQVRDLQAGTQRPVARTELAREVARTQSQHRHGAGER